MQDTFPPTDHRGDGETAVGSSENLADEVSAYAQPGPWTLKRCLDVVASSLALTLFSIPMGVIAFLVRVSMGTPVIFRQARPGVGGESFEMLKFRTMLESRATDGSLLPDSERLTALGGFLRRTSLDELPELWNVLVGDMSLVGPRPLLHRYTPFLTRWELRRAAVRPGITGLAQVNGRNHASWDSRLSADAWYVRHASVALDLRIFLKTVAGVMRSEGVVVDPGSTMQDLDVERTERSLVAREIGPVR